MKFFPVWIVTLAVIMGAACACAECQMLLAEEREVRLGNRQSREWTFPAVDSLRGRVVVEFRNRIDFPTASGWCPCWQIFVNGKVLTSAATRSETRLLNRPYSIPSRWHGLYRADNGSDKWYALYLPDFRTAENQFVPPTSEATRTVLDISDVVRTAGTNVVTLRAGGLPGWLYTANNITNYKPQVVFSGFKVRVEDVPTKLKHIEEKEVRATVAPPIETRFGAKQDGMDVVVDVGGIAIPVRSAFSVPGGGEVSMGCENVLETAFYSVTRKVEVRKNRVDVFDTFLSRTNKLIGVKVRYEIPQKGFDPVYVAGDPSPGAEEFPGGRHPSVFGVRAGKGCAVALLAQDDVFRVQNVQYCKDGVFGIRTDGLALKPGEPRTIEWSIYPMASEDYYDFVNAVRRDWDVNFPIAGCFNLSMNLFHSYSEKGCKRLEQNMGLSMDSFGCHIWSHLGGKYKAYKDVIFGMGMNSPKVRVRIDAKHAVEEDPVVVHRFIRECIANARKYTPNMKVLTYMHNQISVGVDDDKYEECRMVNVKGVKMNYNGGPTQKVFVPTKDNLFGGDYMKLVDWTLDNFDLDGIYHDELSHCNSRKYYGTNMWDGATVELDESNNVKRKVSYVCILKLGFTLDLFDHIMNKRGKLLVGNFSPETRSERRFRFPRFEETYNSRWIALSHLYTPIQLGDMLTYANTPKDMAADQRMALKRGALYYHYCGSTGCPSLTSKMFPFTPIELHGGWLVGKERILTAVSGDFGWCGEKPDVDVFVFDELGREVKDYPYAVKDTDWGRVFTLELKTDHCAAIVKK